MSNPSKDYSVPADPDTSLYSAAELAARSLLYRLDRRQRFRPYFNLKFAPPYPTAEHASWDYCDMSGRFVDAWILARQMLDWPMTEEEESVRQFLLAMQSSEDGLFYDRDATDRPETADMFCQSRALLGLVSWFLESGSTEIEERIERLVRGLWRVAAKQDDFCYYPGHRYSPSGWQGVSAYAAKHMGHAALPAYGVCQLIPLVRYWEATSSPTTERLIQGLLNFFVRESDVIKRDGSFVGHLHSWGILPSTVGVLRYAIAKSDEKLIQWCGRVCDFIVSNSSSFGWVPDGIGVGDGIETGETCCITDLIHLGAKLAECGHPECFDYIEIMLRNQLVENQIRGPDRWAYDPSPDGPDVRSMVHGAYDSWVMPNGLTGCSELGMEGCCTASAVRAVYLAWKHAIIERPGRVQVNLMLSRRSKSVDTFSHQPFEGRFEVLMREPNRVSIRIPRWIDRTALRLTIDDHPADATFAGQFVEFTKTVPGSRIVLEFPLPERRTEESIRGRTYRLSWRGITLMRIEPPGETYPIFQRNPDDWRTLNRVSMDSLHTKPSVDW